MKAALVVTMLIGLFTAGATAQSSPACDSIVKKVSFENMTGLNPEQQASLRVLLVGRCFQREHGDVLSKAVYDELRGWGYKQPTVGDPLILPLDDSLHPSPVAITIDFRLRSSDRSAK
jgi:hypothetical protein